MTLEIDSLDLGAIPSVSTIRVFRCGSQLPGYSVDGHELASTGCGRIGEDWVAGDRR